MLEAFMAAFPWPVIFGGVAGHDAPVLGNRDEQRCPHEVFRCQGEDRWIAISVEDDHQFRRLAAAMGLPELSSDPRFASLAARRLHESTLEGLIGAWTSTLEVDQAVATLTAAGVPAARVNRVDELLGSEELLRRDFFTRFDHPEFGVRPLAGVAWSTSRSPMRVTAAAPALGQHTREVLVGLLGLTAEEVDQLVAGGVAV